MNPDFICWNGDVLTLNTIESVRKWKCLSALIFSKNMVIMLLPNALLQ